VEDLNAVLQRPYCGRWQGDHRKKRRNDPRLRVQLAEVLVQSGKTENGVATGTIVQLFLEPKDKPDPVCDLCEGPEKDQKVVGMVILQDLRSDGSQWSGGTVLDPGNGKRYRCYIEEEEGGERLKVRGYIGISLLGRTQHWYRVEQPDANIRTYLLNGPGELMPQAWADGTIASEEARAAHLAKTSE